MRKSNFVPREKIIYLKGILFFYLIPMLQKFLSLFLLFTLCGASIPVWVQAQEKSFQEIRNEVKALPLGKKLLPQVDALLPRLSDEQLEETLYRIDTIYWEEDISLEQEQVLDYLSVAITQEQDRRNVVVHTSTLPNLEQEKVQTELLEAQKTLAWELADTLDASMIDWNTLNYYEDKGDFSLDFDMNLEALGTIDSGIKLSDYKIKNALFDQQLTAQIDAFITASIQGEDIDMQVKSLLDFITQDGNIYLLAEKLEVSLKDDAMQEEFGDIISKLKELANSKTYLAIKDESAGAFLEALKEVSPENVGTHIRTSGEKPWFVVTGKQNTSYTLVPSIHFCTMMKQALNVFDPFSGDTCTNTQYKDMLEGLEESGTTLLYTPGKNASLRVELSNENVSGNIDLIWSDLGLISFTGHAVNPENPKKDKMSFSYFPAESFEILVETEDDMMIHLSGLMEDKKTISSLNLQGQIDDTAFKLNYAQEQLAFELSASSYNEDTLVCRGSGPLTNQTFNITASCDISSSALTMFVPDSQGSLRIDMKSSGDMLSGNNNYSFSIIGKTPSAQVFSLDMKNTWTRTASPNLKITAPTKTVDMEDVIDEMYESGY